MEAGAALPRSPGAPRLLATVEGQELTHAEATHQAAQELTAFLAQGDHTLGGEGVVDAGHKVELVASHDVWRPIQADASCPRGGEPGALTRASRESCDGLKAGPTIPAVPAARRAPVSATPTKKTHHKNTECLICLCHVRPAGASVSETLAVKAQRELAQEPEAAMETAVEHQQPAEQQPEVAAAQ